MPTASNSTLPIPVALLLDFVNQAAEDGAKKPGVALRLDRWLTVVAAAPRFLQAVDSLNNTRNRC